jgi:CHAD domain-containing protein
MAYRLQHRESVSHGLRRPAKAELRPARRHLRRHVPPTDEAIHEARKSLKKVRAIADLIEADGGRGLDGFYKRWQRANRILSRLRDADARFEILQKLRVTDRRLLDGRSLARLLRRLAAKRQAVRKKARKDEAWVTVDKELRTLRRRAKEWHTAHPKFRPLADGINRLYRKGRKAMTRARKAQKAADFHEFRKHVKQLWYAMRLVEECGPAIKKDIVALERVETWLGDDHNVVVLCEALSKKATVCDGLIDLDRLRQVGHRFQCEARTRAMEVSKRLYARRPAAFVRRINRAWKTGGTRR